jgi:hypothetical protein
MSQCIILQVDDQKGEETVKNITEFLKAKGITVEASAILFHRVEDVGAKFPNPEDLERIYWETLLSKPIDDDTKS